MKPDYSSNVSADSATSYFGTDILGSVRNVTDKYGAVQSNYDYDVFGSPYLNNLENDIGFGYCGKSYDVGTGLYDYGFRDYSPVSARFTTVDPIRDGSNWFSYVVNDPVNYIDPLGLSATDSNRGYPSSTEGYDSSAPAKKEFGNTYSQTYIKNNVPEQYQQQALNALKKEEQAGLYGSPTDSKKVTAGIGGETTLQKVHTGVDLGALIKGKPGDPIYATADGTVIRNGKTVSGSTRVELSLPYTNDTAIYQHANFIVKEGETVERGQIIGYMSDQGTPGQVHLHYEIRENGQYTQDPDKIVNPLDHMPSSYSKQ